MERERILEILKNAKFSYEHSHHRHEYGMCKFIDAEITYEEVYDIDLCYGYNYIQQLIPEFNAVFLGGNPNEIYWWDKGDFESRLKAFDKLIAIYEKDNTIC